MSVLEALLRQDVFPGRFCDKLDVLVLQEAGQNISEQGLIPTLSAVTCIIRNMSTSRYLPHSFAFDRPKKATNAIGGNRGFDYPQNVAKIDLEPAHGVNTMTQVSGTWMAPWLSHRATGRRLKPVR